MIDDSEFFFMNLLAICFHFLRTFSIIGPINLLTGLLDSFKNIFFITFTYLCVCIEVFMHRHTHTCLRVCMCECMHAMACVWRSENNLCELVLSSVSPGV